MVQLKLSSDINDNDLLRKHIDKNIDEIAPALPDESSVMVSIKRVSRTQFKADFHARIFGRLLVVSANEDNLFHAISRARRQLMRQIENVRQQRRDQVRSRPSLRKVGGWHLAGES